MVSDYAYVFVPTEIFIVISVANSSQHNALLQELQVRLEKEQRESSRLAHELSLKTEVNSIDFGVMPLRRLP